MIRGYVPGGGVKRRQTPAGNGRMGMRPPCGGVETNEQERSVGMAGRKGLVRAKVAADAAKDARRSVSARLPLRIGVVELEAVTALGGVDATLVALASGPMAEIAGRYPGDPARGMDYVRRAVRFLASLLSGQRHRAAMDASGLTWAEIAVFKAVSPGFKQMYEAARDIMDDTMEAQVKDVAYEMAVEGEDAYGSDGTLLGRRRSERVLCQMLHDISLDKYAKRKSGGSGKRGRPASLPFDFGGGKKQSMGVIDVGP